MCDLESFWDTDSFWNSTTPRVSKCFQETVVNIIPTSILLLGVTLFFSKKKKDFDGTLTRLDKFRIAGCSLVIIGYASWFLSCLEKMHDDAAFFDSSLTFSLLFNSIKIILYAGLLWIIYQGRARKTNSMLWTASIFELLYLAIRGYHLLIDSASGANIDLVMALYQPIASFLLFLTFSFDQSAVEPCNKSGLRSADQSSFCSKLFTGWFIRLLSYGRRKTLEWDDLPDLPQEMSSSKLGQAFHEELRKHKLKSKTQSQDSIQIHKVVVKMFWKELSFASALAVLNEVMICILPLLMKLFIRFMNYDEEEPVWHGYVIGLTMTFIALLIPFLKYHYDYLFLQSSIKASICLNTAIHGKILSLKKITRGSFSDGKILNLMSIDSTSISSTITQLSIVLGSPVSLIASIMILYSSVSNGSLLGVAAWIILLVPMSAAINAIVRMYRKKLPITDKRIKLINEILNGIKSVKMYAWEECFMEELARLRDKEMDVIRKLDNLSSLTTAGLTLGPSACSLIIITYQWLWDQSSFSVESIFIMLPLVSMLSRPFGNFPWTLQAIKTGMVSLERLNAFLSLDEKSDYVERRSNLDALIINGGDFSWKQVETRKSDSSINDGLTSGQELVPLEASFKLKGVDFDARKGQFVCIIGSVGSGKTSILNALLGEMVKMAGEVVIPTDSRIAFVPQESWIQNMTLRENIVFGSPFDEEWYRQVLTACELWPDIAILPHGDQSEVGENGINLSGGQKQRINLARAVYHDADIYIMDDCLSAVDAHVSKRLFDQVLSSQTGLLKCKTRILATHRLDFLSEVDKIILVDSGSIKWTGNFDQLRQSESIESKFLESLSSKTNTSTQKSTEGSTSKKIGSSDLTGEEKMKDGSSNREILLSYWKKSPKFLLLVLIISTAANFWASIYSRIVLVHWTEDSQGSQLDEESYFTLYAGSTIFQACIFLVSLVASGEVFIRTVSGVYTDAQSAVLYSPLRFFDTTPIGRILNRFSQDTNTLDLNARGLFKMTLWYLASLIPAIVGSIIQAPLISIMMLGIGIILLYLWTFLMPAYRRLKRLQSVAQSPIYSQFRETLSGSTCIRAFQSNERFSQEFCKKLDVHGNCHFLVGLASIWRTAAFSLVSSGLYVFITLYGVMNKGEESAAGIGLLLSYIIRLGDMLGSCVGSLSELEIVLVAAERLHEFSQLPEEGERFKKPKELPIEWPASGEVSFQDYSAKYSQTLTSILKNVTFSINKGEKIGIVGRTGAGKSSLTLALYRLIERLNGTIMIDGADISNIGLFHLRSAVSIIPQDPVIFSESLRFNLDPFEKYSDTEIWRCLELTQLRGYFEKFGQGLDYAVEEGGKNLSTGQKQLMCLARSILRKSKIVVLDEATSSIDMETDSLIQDTLRSEFTESTMLIVAHRLNTIINCDRVMVLDDGKLMEFDSPQKLLADKASRFFALAREAKLTCE